MTAFKFLFSNSGALLRCEAAEEELRDTRAALGAATRSAQDAQERCVVSMLAATVALVLHPLAAVQTYLHGHAQAALAEAVSVHHSTHSTHPITHTHGAYAHTGSSCESTAGTHHTVRSLTHTHSHVHTYLCTHRPHLQRQSLRAQHCSLRCLLTTSSCSCWLRSVRAHVVYTCRMRARQQLQLTCLK